VHLIFPEVVPETVSINIWFDIDLVQRYQQQQYLFANRRSTERASVHQRWLLTKNTPSNIKCTNEKTPDISVNLYIATLFSAYLTTAQIPLSS